MTYLVFKMLHLLGVILLIGNVTVTSVWKVFADRTRDPHTIRFAQRMVTLTDWGLTCTAIALLTIGGYGMVWVVGMSLFDAGWLLWGQVLFVVSGVIWLGVLVPLQSAQSRLADAFDLNAPVPEAYWRLCRRWLVVGLVATVPLVGAVYIMMAKR